MALTALGEVDTTRRWLAAPLVDHDAGAHAPLAYVLAGGAGVDERLRAVARLFAEERVQRVILVRDASWGRWHFGSETWLQRFEWSVAYLGWLGVPSDRVDLLKVPEGGGLGTLAEARAVAAHLPEEVQRLVVITSAAHTRRARLAFQRVIGDRAEVLAYAATRFHHSVEAWAPLWREYAKLLVYALVAW